jgi:SAM-dependent methyltransferase
MSFTHNTKRIVRLTGFKPGRLIRNLRRLPAYVSEYRQLRRQAQESSQPFELGDLFPVLDETTQPAGSASGHYFHQDLHVARLIRQRNPDRHIDVGSRIDGFVAHVAAFRDIDVIDVRQMASTTPGINFVCADLMQDLPSELLNATDSLSCLHAIEHFGLGRYGAPIDFEGHMKGIANLQRMLKPGGTLYLSTPITHRQRIEFNAHRVFTIPYLRTLFSPLFEIRSFAFVGDDGQLNTNVDAHGPQAACTFDLNYGCGIFELADRRHSAANAA